MRRTVASDAYAWNTGRRCEGAHHFVPQAVGKFFEKMSKETIEKFIADGGKLFHATESGPSDCMVLPFNFVFLEKISRQCDATGCKIGFYCQGQDEEFESANKWLIGASAPNAALADAVDATAA